ncbi:metallophosphoesterase family protein [Asaia siamensis]
MKIAVLADIHGNLTALDAVLADCALHGVDRLAILGDHFSGPLLPFETAERLISLTPTAIAGNHERQLLTQSFHEMGESDRFTCRALAPHHFDWMTRLPATLQLENHILLVHGTPTSDTAYFLETVSAEGLRPATQKEIVARADGTDARIILCGHTHIQRKVAFGGGRLALNPGSVGLPAYEDDEPFPHQISNASPHARYALLNGVDGDWAASFHTVAYDWEQAAQIAERNGRPDWARALRTGRL